MTRAAVTGAGPVRRRLRDESGSVLPLVLVYLLVAAGLVGVTTDAAAVFLAQRGLAAAADGAALAAAQQASEAALYAGAAGPVLPPDPEAAGTAVARYVGVQRLSERFEGFAVLGVDADATVTVALAARVRPPVSGRLLAAYAGGVPLAATARARLVVQEAPPRA